MVFLLIIVFLDILIINISYIFAYFIKFKLAFTHNIYLISYGNFIPHAQIEPYLKALYIITLLWLICLLFFRVYERRTGILAGIEEFIKVSKAGISATILIFTSLIVFNYMPGSKYVLLLALVLSIVGIVVLHQIIFTVYSKLNIVKVKKVIIMGTDEKSQALYERLIYDNNHHYQVVGAIGIEPVKISYALDNKFIYLGGYDSLWDYTDLHKVREVFIATTDLSRFELSEIINSVIDKGIDVKIIPSFYDLVSNKIEVHNFIGIPLFTVSSTELSTKQYLVKRILDLIIASMILVLSSPVLIITSILLILENKGGVIYKQERVGKDGEPFNILKFRSMPADAEKASGPVIQTNNNNRATNLGKFLRKASIDELPQLINVLKGEMSIVGPRPERPFFVEQFSKEIKDYDKRIKVLPGITGWAQINGRAALSTRIDEKLMYDLYYINNWSLVFDIKIIIRTILEVFKWHEAY